MRYLTIFGIICGLFSLNGCYPRKYVQYLESIRFDSIKQITRFDRLPLGYVEIPGNWHETRSDNVSKQQFFKNNDSVTIAIALWPKDRYGVYKKGQSDKSFLNDFYEWDSKYLADQIQGQRNILSQDSIQNNFILWRVYNDSLVDSYFLFGIKQGTVYNLYVTSKKWSDIQKIEFLENLFLKIK